MCIKISLIRGMALLHSWTKNITCVILMLLFLMSKDPVLSTVSVREAFTGRIQCSLQTWVCSGKARCVQAVRRPFQHKKGLWFQLSCHQVLPFVKFSRSRLFSQRHWDRVCSRCPLTLHISHECARPRTTQPVSLKKSFWSLEANA